jgi:excinuclease ABC subunit C
MIGHYMASDMFTLVNLPHDTHIIKLLQRIRDESHRFAVSYHTVLKRSGQTKSVLDDIPGVGPVLRKKLIRQFGSARGVAAASLEDMQSAIGEKRGQEVFAYLRHR